MKAKIKIQENSYRVDLMKFYDISISVGDEASPVAYGAPALEIKPFKDEGFTGSLEAGSPVNFYNIRINPHGNGTHTETARHISREAPSISELNLSPHHIARLITVTPRITKDADSVVDLSSYDWDSLDLEDVNAIIIRTKPNSINKRRANYTGTNPAYYDHELLSWLNKRVDHLLIDLPSVDKEQDGGALKGHKAFWQTEKKPDYHKTITEMVFVDSVVNDGLYLLELQVLSLNTDASPSRPLLFPLKKA
ncbi:MAG: cyclase family protein [Saprospiraceae bacterium]